LGVADRNGPKVTAFIINKRQRGDIFRKSSSSFHNTQINEYFMGWWVL